MDERDLTALSRAFEAAEALAHDASAAALEARLSQYRFVIRAAPSSSQALPPSPEVQAAPVSVASAPSPVEAAALAVDPASASVEPGAPAGAPTDLTAAAPAPSGEPTAAIAAPAATAPTTPTDAPAPPALDLSTQVADARAQAAQVLSTLRLPVQHPSHRRAVRFATAFTVALTVLVLGGAKLVQWTEPTDLAKGKPWHASSALFQCAPERIDCGGTRTTIFFHTLFENEPWVVVDLQTPTSFSAVTVVNRRDAAKERAVPLVLEVSDDEKTWRQLARRDDEFSVWKARFDATTARFVRLKVARASYLHLDAVKVHP